MCVWSAGRILDCVALAAQFTPGGLRRREETEMAYTTAQIEAIIADLESSMASASQSEQFNDRRVSWSTAEQILARIAYWKALLAESQDSATTRYVRMRASGMGY